MLGKMPPGEYVKPPITEAVIELRFETSVSQDAMEKFVRDVKERYPSAEEKYEVAVELKIAAASKEPVSTLEKKLVGYKLTGSEDTDLILFDTDRIANIRLAPYCGWGIFWEKTEKNFGDLKKRLGYRKIVRMATRYVNRIDIPKLGKEVINSNDYLLIEPEIPSVIKTIHNFKTQFVAPIPEVEGKVTVNAATVQSPLIDHVSLLLDIDLFKDQNVPQKDNEVWELFSHLHRQKNKIFEAFITDKARELFDRA